MDLDNLEIPKITTSEISMEPFAHFVKKDFFSTDFWEHISEELTLIEQTKPDKKFESDFGVKAEWKTFPQQFKYVNAMLDQLFSAPFIEELKTAFGIDHDISIFPDRTFDGGGFVISPPGAYLAYHADFNFSSEVDAYRILNILVYANNGYTGDKGGQLHLLDPDSKTVEKIVEPFDNTLLAFLTDDIAFHGVSRNKSDFKRKSFNLYYYASRPVSQKQSTVPHKTIWLDFGNSDHTHGM